VIQKLGKPGKEVPKKAYADAIIKAVASERGEVICTRNKQDFEQFSVQIEVHSGV
jgi:predicted nucleic acid-binding protein